MSITTQTPPNTNPPTATGRGIGEGQHLHGAGEEQDAAVEHVARRRNDAVATQARPGDEDDGRATSCTSGGESDGTAIVQSVDISTSCIPTSPQAATVRPSDWQRGVIVPQDVLMLRVDGRAQPQGGDISTQ